LRWLDPNRDLNIFMYIISHRQKPNDWFFHALKLHKNDIGGQYEKIKRRPFLALLTELPPRTKDGLGGI
jgi:hypothetical protein